MQLLSISFPTLGKHNAFSPSTSVTFFHLQDFVRNVLGKTVRIIGLFLGCVVE